VNVAIVGSRGYPDRSRVARFVHALAAKHPGAVVVSGGARDVDTWAEETALIEGLGVVSYRPYEFEAMEGGKLFSIETLTHGDAAQELVVAKHRRINPPAFTRNGWIVEDAEQVVAFWDGSSSGTADTLERARLAGVPRHVYEVAA
jgi:hypothetical protein